MAIKITNWTGTKLHDTNAFYNVESSNLSYASSTNGTWYALNAIRYLSLTFDAGGVFKWVMSAFLSTTPWMDRSVTITLQEYVWSTWTDRSSQTISWATMTANITTSYKHNGMYRVNFDNFDTAITVDTTANKRRLSYVQTGGTTGNITLMRWYNASTPHYAAYCDNVSSFANGDTPIIAHPTEIWASATFNSVLWTGDTVYWVACIICSNLTDASVDNVCFLTVLNPVASYTLTLSGIMLINWHSGFRVGTATNPIPIANRFNILLNTSTVWTIKGSIRSHNNHLASSYNYSSRCSLFLYGEIWITSQRGELAADAEIGTNTITMTEDMSTYWRANGDVLAIWKQDVIWQWSIATYIISNISWTTITLTTTIATYKRFSGWSVINMTENNYGISLKSNNTTTTVNYLVTTNNINIEWTYIWNNYSMGSNSYYYNNDNDANTIKMTFKDCCVVSTSTSTYYFRYTHRVNSKWLELDNLIGHRTIPHYTVTQYKSALYKSWPLTIKNIWVLSRYNWYIGLWWQAVTEVDNIIVENSYTNYDVILWWFWATYSNIFTRWLAWSGSTYGSIYLTWIWNKYSNIKADNHSLWAIFVGTAIDVNNLYLNFNLWQEKANTYDYYVNDWAYIDSVFKNCKWWNTKYNEDMTGTTVWSMIRFVNYNEVVNNDFVLATYWNLVRTGDWLADTTTHTAGANKFAIRLEPLLTNTPLKLSSDTPTGDIMGKQLILGVWCKINSADYYSWTYQMPRLTVSYDDWESTVYVEATKTTERQYLFISVTPATSFGQVSVYLGADTDQASANAYVYFDDFSTFYPPWVQLNLGWMDLFAKWLPISPYIATNINVSDIRTYPTSAITVTGSIGVLIKKMYTFILSLL